MNRLVKLTQRVKRLRDSCSMLKRSSGDFIAIRVLGSLVEALESLSHMYEIFRYAPTAYFVRHAYF